MKKLLYALPIVIFLIVIIKYLTSDYTINYKIGDFTIEESIYNKVKHYTIKKDDLEYKYIFYNINRKIKKDIESISYEEINDYKCLTPVIRNINSYTICEKEGKYYSKELALNTIEYKTESEDLVFNSLNDNEYMVIWKYNGLYYFSGNNKKEINLFNFNRYSNDLMFLYDKYLIFPKYEQDNYLFSDFYIFDMTNSKESIIKTEYTISYNSYWVGNYKDYLYLFDNTNENLYKINYKKKIVELVGSNIKGYEKIVNNKIVDAKKNEYTKDKITFFSNSVNSINYIDNKITYDYFEYIYAKEDIKVITSNDKSIYYIYKDNVYRFDENNTSYLLHFFELNFNKDNNIFIYQNNK